MLVSNLNIISTTLHGDAVIFKVFAADLSDLQWMCELYYQAARNGHFNVDYRKPNFRKMVESMLQSSIEHQIMPDKRRAQSMVFEYNNERIGYAIVAEIDAGIGGTELHIMIVDPKFRDKGFGKLILNEIIHRWHSITDIHVVCYPRSSAMKHILSKYGFHLGEQDNEGTCLFILEKQLQQLA